MDSQSKILTEQLLELRYALRNYRLTRRQPLFEVASELNVPAPILVQIESNKPIDASPEELATWLERLKKVAEASSTPQLFVPPFLRG
jgi:hypothetical protein